MKKLVLLGSNVILLYVVLGACRPRQDEVYIDLPSRPPEPVVECYLLADSIIQLSLTQTVPYFEVPDDLPLITDANVFISTANQTDTLRFFPPLAPNLKYPLGEYRSQNRISNDTSLIYNLTIQHGGKIITSKTKLMPALVVDSVRYNFDSRDKASLRFWWKDPDPNQINYYRITYYEQNPDSNRKQNNAPNPELSDQFLPPGKPFFATGYSFERNDTVIIDFYHIAKDYYNFIETFEDAVTGNRSPFAEPSRILSNVNGGVGIFTAPGRTQVKLILK